MPLKQRNQTKLNNVSNFQIKLVQLNNVLTPVFVKKKYNNNTEWTVLTEDNIWMLERYKYLKYTCEGKYFPELKSFLIRFNVLHMFQPFNKVQITILIIIRPTNIFRIFKGEKCWNSAEKCLVSKWDNWKMFRLNNVPKPTAENFDEACLFISGKFMFVYLYWFVILILNYWLQACQHVIDNKIVLIH